MDKIFGLSEFPIMPIVDIVSRIKTGVEISDAAPIKSVEKISVPILFIHVDADKLVPYEMMNRIYYAATSPIFNFIDSLSRVQPKWQNRL